MALRCLLVSMVACLGFQLPTGRDVNSWSLAGRDWVSARVVDLSALGAEASGWLTDNDPTMNRPGTQPTVAAAGTEAPAAAEAVATTLPADLAFDSINEGMALAFADDLQAAQDRQARAEIAAPAVALAAAEETPAVACQPDDDSFALAFPAEDAESTRDEGTEVAETTAPASDKLASAVRLTREAVQAWAAVIQPLGDEPTASR